MQPIHMLVVDDEPQVARAVANCLKTMGPRFVVETAYNFAQAFSMAQRTSYALLITDHKMPGLNGLDLARAVGRVSPDTKVILMTAYSTKALRGTAQLLDLAGCLEKPFTLAQIQALVLRALGGAATARHVLLLEDKTDVRRVYSECLRKAGYLVCEATSLQQARHYLTHYRFDIFLCALDITGNRALDLVREQAARLSQTGTPVIAISTEGGYRPICEEMGVEFLLETPVAVTPLVTLVDRLTAQH